MKHTDSETILTALQTTEHATASDLATKTGVSIKKVSAALHHLISSGKVFHIGEVPISNSRQVNLYSSTKPVAEVMEFKAQTWLSALMQ